MPQDINLMHAGLRPRPAPFRSMQAASILGSGALLMLIAFVGLQQLASRRTVEAVALEQEFAALQRRATEMSAVAAPSRPAAELRLLRDTEAGQRQVRAALDSGVAGRPQGYAQYFMALSRQAQASLWITGFNVAADGAGLELQGRMTDPRVLPDYLRRLNSEPLFKGREFAQMSLKVVEPAPADGASPAITEFALRARPVAAPASP